MAMDEIVHLLATAGRRVRPQLLRDPAELRRRLARRDTPLLTRPPRAWCLCIRANDTRIDPLRTSRPSPINNHQPHEICLITDDLRRLTAPVHIDRLGEPLLSALAPATASAATPAAAASANHEIASVVWAGAR